MKARRFPTKFVCDGPSPCRVGDALSVSRALGLRSYFTGQRCVNGHVSWRLTRNTECLECRKEEKKRWQKGPKSDDHRKRVNRRKYLRRKSDPAFRDRERVRLRIKKRARERGVPGRHTAADIKLIFKAQRGRCAYFRNCNNRLGDDYHVDHIYPIALGGTNDRSNIQLACPACNQLKSAQHPVDFAQSIGLLI